MELILLMALLGLSAMFSGTETAYFSLGPAELARLAAGSGAGRQVLRLLERPHELLSALLVGNLVVNTAASVVTTTLCMQWFGPRGLVIAVPAATLALLMLGEITPKMLALRFRRRVAMAVHVPLAWWVKANGPALKLLSLTMGAVLDRLPHDRSGTRPLTIPELETACDLAVEDGVLTETEGRSLARLLRLDNLAVAHVMTPRTEVVTVRRDWSLDGVLAVAREAGFNRYPVLGGEGVRPVGLFHLKDLLDLPAGGTTAPLEGSLRPLLFVPERKDVAALLAEMRGGAGHLAAVVDEHGDFTGIVTMADCLQALMGPVADAGAQETRPVPLGDDRWIIDGRADLRELEEACGLSLPTSRDYVTVAGFLMAELGRVLQPGDRVTLPTARLTVLEMLDHRVERIQVTLLPAGRPGDRQEQP